MSAAGLSSQERLSRRKAVTGGRSSRPLALVTGATGFIGGHLVETLLARGYAVRAFARDEARAAGSLPEGVQVVLGDVRDADSLRAAMVGVDLVFHAAAAVGLWGRWRWFQQATVQGTEKAVRAAQEAGVRRFVHFSSVAVYREDALTAGPVRETAPLTGGRWTGAFGFYGRSKMLAERAAFRHHSDRGTGVTVLRPAWVYGPRDDSILPYLRLYLKTPLAPWLGQSDPVMPFVYVTDVAEAAVLAAETEGAAGRPYNLAGPGYPLRDFLWELADGLGARVPSFRIPQVLARAAALAVETWALPLSPWLAPPLTPSALALLERGVQVDCSRARRELGWAPRVPMTEGLDATLEWLRTEERRRRPGQAGARAARGA